MSGGKGGGSTSSTQIPDWIKEPTQRSVQRAEEVSNIGYMPYYGMDVAGFNPTQQMAMGQNIQTAQAFGMAPQGQVNPLAGLPQAQYDPTTGFSGYSASPMYEMALSEIEQRQPTFMQRYQDLYTDEVPPLGEG